MPHLVCGLCHHCSDSTLCAFCSKLKKMYRTIQEEKGKKRAAENNDQEEERPKQQFDKDFTLEPFEGVSPEYMEMSESPFYSQSHSLLLTALTAHLLQHVCSYSQ